MQKYLLAIGRMTSNYSYFNASTGTIVAALGLAGGVSRVDLCQALGEREALPGERTLDKAFASLGRLEGVQTQWGKRGECLYREGRAENLTS